MNSSQIFFSNMPVGVTPASHQIYHLHMLAFYICLGILLVVSVVLFYFLIKYKKTSHPHPSSIHSSLLIEVIWITIPFILLIIMGLPASLFLIKGNRFSEGDINIKITGHQWKWQYEYLDDGVEFLSNLATPLNQIQGKSPKNDLYLREVDQPLVVPVNKKIHFLVTSSDVIHSWWVPELGIKRDAIPGFIYESTAIIQKPGIYRGQCAELCGINHAYMPIVVEAKTDEDFYAWLAEKKNTINTVNSASNNNDLTELMAEGKLVYQSQCAACHQLNGSGMPPTFPALQGGKVVIGPLARHIDIVINGLPNTAMAAFGDQLTAEQIAAVITYERNSWGNNNQLKYGFQAGGIVRVSDVQNR